MPLPKFGFSGSIYDIPGSVSAGELDQVALTKTRVLFTANLPDDKFIVFGGNLNRPPLTVYAQVDDDGTLVKDGAPLKLLANDADLSWLGGSSITNIQWKGSVKLPIPGPLTEIVLGPFLAPGDGDTLNLGAIVLVDAGAPGGDGGAGSVDGGEL